MADDNVEAARANAARARSALAAMDMSLLAGPAHERWMESLKAMSQALDAMGAAKDIETFRGAFAPLSSELARVAKTFGPVRSTPLYNLRCPMAFDNRGATWLQKDQAVRNPYFGKAMLACGEVIEVIEETFP